MKSIGKPYEGKLHVRFDEGGADSSLTIIIFMNNNFEWIIRLYSTGALKIAAIRYFTDNIWIFTKTNIFSHSDII